MSMYICKIIYVCIHIHILMFICMYIYNYQLYRAASGTVPVWTPFAATCEWWRNACDWRKHAQTSSIWWSRWTNKTMALCILMYSVSSWKFMEVSCFLLNVRSVDVTTVWLYVSSGVVRWDIVVWRIVFWIFYISLAGKTVLVLCVSHWMNCPVYLVRTQARLEHHWTFVVGSPQLR